MVNLLVIPEWIGAGSKKNVFFNKLWHCKCGLLNPWVLMSYHLYQNLYSLTVAYYILRIMVEVMLFMRNDIACRSLWLLTASLFEGTGIRVGDLAGNTEFITYARLSIFFKPGLTEPLHYETIPMVSIDPQWNLAAKTFSLVLNCF